MHPVCLQIGALTIHWYGVMMALGFFAGLAGWVVLGRRRGWDFAFCSDLLFWMMVSGVLGGRLAYVLGDLNYFLERPSRIIRIDQGGLVYYGGFIGATLAAVFFARSKRVRFLAVSDFAVTSLPLGHAFGRVGCLLNGCCHGHVTGSVLGVSYPRDSFAWRSQWHAGELTDWLAPQSLAVHPVQLYEAGFNILLYVLLLWQYRRTRKEGAVTAFYFVAYAIGRFLLEFFRGDARTQALGLSAGQLVSVAICAAGVVLWWRARDAGGGSPTVGM